VLFTWSDGIEKVADATAARAYGESLARLHKCGRTISSDAVPAGTIGHRLPGERGRSASCGRALAHRPKEALRLKRVGRANRAEIRRRKLALSWGSAWRSLRRRNARIKDGVTTFFDFDLRLCGPGGRSYDLANFLWGPA
jgi:Ser/Thr protein kinase RdoA (MazF antagonist)